VLGSHRESRSDETDVSSGRLTPRAILLGLLCVVLVTFVTAWAERVVRHIILGALTFPPLAVGVLILLTLVNRLLRRWRPRWVLRPTESLVIYIMMLLSAWTSSLGGPARLGELAATAPAAHGPPRRGTNITRGITHGGRST
jgi:energy-coupling factor transporter transmembrane protein EcfT